MYDATVEEQVVQMHPIDPTTLPRDQRAAYWAERIQAWRQSGLSQTVFCRQEKLVAHQFTYWLGKSHSTSPESVERKTSTGGFVPVSTVTPTTAPLQITLPNGIVLTGISDQNLPLVQQFIQSL